MYLLIVSLLVIFGGLKYMLANQTINFSILFKKVHDSEMQQIFCKVHLQRYIRGMKLRLGSLDPCIKNLDSGY